MNSDIYVKDYAQQIQREHRAAPWWEALRLSLIVGSVAIFAWLFGYIVDGLVIVVHFFAKG